MAMTAQSFKRATIKSPWSPGKATKGRRDGQYGGSAARLGSIREQVHDVATTKTKEQLCKN